MLSNRTLLKWAAIYLLLSGMAIGISGLSSLGSGAHLGIYLSEVCPASSPYKADGEILEENKSCKPLTKIITSIQKKLDGLTVFALIGGLISVILSIFLWLYISKEEDRENVH